MAAVPAHQSLVVGQAHGGDQIHGSALAGDRASMDSSRRSCPGSWWVALDSTKLRSAPSVPGSGNTRLITLENDYREPIFHAFKREYATSSKVMVFMFVYA